MRAAAAGHGRRGRVLLPAAFACALALAAPAATVPANAAPAGLVAATATDPAPGPGTERVREAEQRVDEADAAVTEAERLAAELSAALDTAAGHYELTLAHRLRLEEESGSLSQASESATAQASDAEDAFARQVAASYMYPGASLEMARAIVLAPDATTAMHRASLLERIAERERARADQALEAAALAGDVERQQRIVQAGVRGAEADNRRRADDLELALSTAVQRAEQARAQLAAARTERDEVVAEEEARLEAERLAAELAALGAGPLPPVDGKVCPLAAPNAFIDSWGYPRSGGRSHKGVDMFASYGAPVYAVADGVVRRVWNNRLGGLSIDLVDDRGDRYYYAHLSAAVVGSGQRVVAGQVVGANGDSGNARGTPPHLHWQYHPGDGPAVNPYPLARALCRP